MVNLDMQNGVATFAPPVVVAGEVGAKLAGLTINEWFYVVAIFCMLLSTVASTAVAVLKAKSTKNKEE